jgi:hypothetical protein
MVNNLHFIPGMSRVFLCLEGLWGFEFLVLGIWGLQIFRIPIISSDFPIILPDFPIILSGFTIIRHLEALDFPYSDYILEVYDYFARLSDYLPEFYDYRGPRRLGLGA